MNRISKLNALCDATLSDHANLSVNSGDLTEQKHLVISKPLDHKHNKLSIALHLHILVSPVIIISFSSLLKMKIAQQYVEQDETKCCFILKLLMTQKL